MREGMTRRFAGHYKYGVGDHGPEAMMPWELHDAYLAVARARRCAIRDAWDHHAYYGLADGKMWENPAHGY